MRSMWSPMGVTLALVVVAGCSASPPPPPEPTRLQSVDVGAAIDADNAITTSTRTFDPQSVVYLSVATEGAMPATLTVQWYGNTKLIDTETLPIHPTGPAKFAFHYLPSGGWPSGKSRAIFSLTPEDKHAVEFEVR